HPETRPRCRRGCGIRARSRPRRGGRPSATRRPSRMRSAAPPLAGRSIVGDNRQSRTRMGMHRLLLPAAVLVPALPLCGPPAVADAHEAIDRARAMLSRNDARGAVAALEEALPTVTPDDRRGLLDLLREAYEAAIRQAEVDGRPGDAEAFRDNL